MRCCTGLVGSDAAWWVAMSNAGPRCLRDATERGDTATVKKELVRGANIDDAGCFCTGDPVPL